jgi:hypothetical protein
MSKYKYEHTYKPEMLVCPEFKIPVMPEGFELARAYVPYQVMCKIYEPMKGLMRGTIFPELYRPYVSEKKNR